MNAEMFDDDDDDDARYELLSSVSSSDTGDTDTESSHWLHALSVINQ